MINDNSLSREWRVRNELINGEKLLQICEGEKHVLFLERDQSTFAKDICSIHNATLDHSRVDVEALRAQLKLQDEANDILTRSCAANQAELSRLREEKRVLVEALNRIEKDGMHGHFARIASEALALADKGEA